MRRYLPRRRSSPTPSDWLSEVALGRATEQRFRLSAQVLQICVQRLGVRIVDADRAADLPLELCKRQQDIEGAPLHGRGGVELLGDGRVPRNSTFVPKSPQSSCASER